MKKVAKVLAVGLLLALMTITRANAETNSLRTNVLLNLTFSLTAYEQVYLFLSTNEFNGPYVPIAKTSKVATSGIIKAIRDYAQITNDLSNAKLYWRLSWTNPVDITRSIILRKPGGNIMGTNDTLVDSYILVSFPDSVSTVSPTVSGTTNMTEYANCNASLGTTAGSFTLYGIATIKSASLTSAGHVIDPTPFPMSFTASVYGSGKIASRQAEWKGTVTASGQKVEIEQISP
jgi:hypothetical protein